MQGMRWVRMTERFPFTNKYVCTTKRSYCNEGEIIEVSVTLFQD